MKINKVIFLLLCLTVGAKGSGQVTELDSLEIEALRLFSSHESRPDALSFIEELSEGSPEKAILLCKKLLSTTEGIKEDEAVIDLYMLLAEIENDDYQLDSAKAHLLEAIHFAKAQNEQTLEAEATLELGQVLMELDDSLAIRTIKESIALGLWDTKPKELARSHYILGRAFKWFSQYDSARHYINMTIDISQHANLKVQEADAWNVLGNMESNEYNIVEGLKNYQEGLRIAEEIGDLELKALFYGNIAISHDDLEDLDKAEEYYLKTIALDQQLKTNQEHLSQFNLGILYIEQERYEEARMMLIKAFNYRKARGMKRYEMTASVRLAKVYFLLGQPDSSRFYHDNTVGLMEEVSSKWARSSALQILGEINLKVENLRLAEEQFLNAYRLNLEMDLPEENVYLANYLYEIYLLKGDYREALKYLEEYVEIADENLNKEQVRDVARLEEQYKHEKEIIQKQNEIDLLESKEQISRLRSTLVLGGTLLVLIIGFIISRNRIKSKTLQAEQVKEMSDFKESMTGMIVHDIKNPLSIILNSTDERVNKEMAARILRLVNDMLDVHRFENANVPLQIERVKVKDLIDAVLPQVKPLAFEKNIDLQQEFTDGLVEVDVEMISRVFINLLTNAIKYAPSSSSIEIKTVEEEDGIIFSVTDQGQGMTKKEQQIIFDSFEQVSPKASGGVGSTGLGLTFVKLALEAHDTDIEVDSEVGRGTTFKFRLPKAIDSDLSEQNRRKMDFSSFSSMDRNRIANQILALKKLNIHQIGEIEKELNEIELKENEDIHEWVEAVLNAAYAGNVQDYFSLINQVETDN